MPISYSEKDVFPVLNSEAIKIAQDYSKKDIYMIGINKRYFTINKDGLDLLQYFDGDHRIGEILADLRKNDKLESEEDILNYIKALVNFNILNLCPKREKKEVDIIALFAKNSHRQVEVTRECNLACNFCFNNCSPGHGQYLTQPINALKTMIADGVNSIEITGGEPLLHKEIYQILAFSLKHFEKVALLTNGVLINDEILDLVQGHEHFTIQISLPTLDPKRYKEINGVDKLARVLKNIQGVMKRNIKRRITTLVIDEKSLNDVKEIADYLVDMGMSKIYSYSVVIPIGRARDKTDLGIPREDFVALYELSKNHPAFNHPKEFINDFYNDNCGAGWKNSLVQPDLKMRPCGMFPVEYASDIINDLNFRKKMFHLPAPSETFCTDCEFMLYCKGCILRGWDRAEVIGVENCNWVSSTDAAEIMDALLKS